ncbi:unnamed protein product [Ectocarpus sp. 4 AP-2014]
MTTAAFSRPPSPHSVAKLHDLTSNVEDRKKSRAHSSQDTDAQLRKLQAGLVHHTKNTDNRDRYRRLQTCAEGSGVTVTSSMFPLLEGCLVEMDLIEGGEVEFVGETGVITSELNSDDVDAEYIWVASYGTTSLVLACISLEPVTSVHPSTATWYCVDDTTEDGVVAATDTTFGVDCGCDDDATAPTPTVTTTPAPDVYSTTPTAPSGGSCSEGESFTVDISALPEAEGCYLSTGSTLSDEHVYTQTGGVDGAEMWIYSLPISDDADAAIYWYLAYVPEIISSSLDGELTLYCGSFEEADTVHPADANWVCTFASSSTQTFGADGAGFTCGCSSDPTPEPTEPPLPDPTPEPTEPLPEPTSEPVLATPEPVSPTPGPVSTTPEPTVLTTPETVIPTPEPVSTTPEPVSTTPEPTVLTTPEPVTPTPEPVTPTPEPVSTTPEPTVSTTPEQVNPTLEPVSATPQPVSTTPEPTALTTPEPVPTTLEPVPAAPAAVGATTPAPVSLTEPPVVTPTSGPAPSMAPTSGQPPGSRGLTQRPTSAPTSFSPAPAITGGTPSPTLEPIDFPDVVPAPSSSPGIAPSSPTCGETESFQIISSDLPVVQGCFQATSSLFSTPESTEEFWSLTGEAEFESILVGAILDEDTEEEGDSTPWYLVFLSEDDDATVTYCFSNEQGILVHPTDATWRCDLDGTGVYSDVTAEEVSFTCGCTGTPAPAPDPIALPESPTGTSPPVEPDSDDGGIIGRRLSTSALVVGATSVLAIALALGMGV